MSLAALRVARLLACYHQQQQQQWCTCSTLPVISVPLLLKRKLEQKEKQKAKQDTLKARKQRVTDSRRGNKQVCLVECKNPALNHYKGQSYGKREGVTLASKGWKHHRSVGDYFTLRTIAESPEEQHHSHQIAEDGVGRTFEQLGIHPDIAANIEKRLDISTPTDIQVRSISRVLTGENCLLAASTGSGKTLAFLAPVVDRLYREGPRDPSVTNRPRALIITPGRELASQVKYVSDQLCHDLPLRTRLLLGGRTKKKMENPSVLQMDILVASFGALSKLTTVGILDLSEVRWVVLDEADTLLDDTFRDDVRHFLSKLRLMGDARDVAAQDGAPLVTPSGVRQTATSLVLAAATEPRQMEALLEGLVLESSVRRVTTPGLHRLLPHVQQRFLRLSPSQRPERLLELCRQALTDHQSVIVFSNRSGTCDWVDLYLGERNVRSLNVSGNMHYKIRQGRWEAFCSGPPAVLSCTDLVSRGLDPPPNISHVINYDFPWNTSDYIHRVGRLGRASYRSQEHQQSPHTVTNFVCRPLEVEVTQRIELAARSGETLWNVDANIRHIIERRQARRPDPALGH